MLSLYKTLVRPHVEYCSCAWNPHYNKDKELLEKIQHRYKLVKTRCTRDITKYFFSNEVINRWHLLDQRMVDARTISAFKSRLVNIRDNRMSFFMD